MDGQPDLGHADAGHHPADVAWGALPVDEAVQAIAGRAHGLELPLHACEKSGVAVEPEALGYH